MTFSLFVAPIRLYSLIVLRRASVDEATPKHRKLIVATRMTIWCALFVAGLPNHYAYAGGSRGIEGVRARKVAGGNGNGTSTRPIAKKRLRQVQPAASKKVNCRGDCVIRRPEEQVNEPAAEHIIPPVFRNYDPSELSWQWYAGGRRRSPSRPNYSSATEGGQHCRDCPAQCRPPADQTLNEAACSSIDLVESILRKI